jgi:hypothetical protein
MANKQSASNQFVRALLTLIGENRDLDVLGLIPSQLQGKKIRVALLEEFKNSCAYCGTSISMESSDIDHLIPMNKSSVGLHMYGNLVPSCKPCNAAKHSKSLEEFLAQHPHRVSVSTIEKLRERASVYGADLDTNALRDFANEIYAHISELLEDKKAQALMLLPKPNAKVEAKAIEFKGKADYDFSDIAKTFPLGALVRAAKDGKTGVVVDYSLEGDKGKRKPYIRFKETPDSKAITRSPNQLDVIRLR